MSLLAKKLSSAIISRGIAKEDDRELYEYSFLIMLEQASVWVTILIISCVFGVFWETTLYMVLFVPLRVYAGGYHARTFSWCYIISVGGYLAYVILLGHVAISNGVLLIVVLVSSVVILILAPMADPNKPMDVRENVKFKKLVRILLLVELVIFTLSFLANYSTIISFISFVFFQLALLLLMGRIYLQKE